MLPLLSFHALAAQRGDGLRPELRALLEQHARRAPGLTATIEFGETAPVPEPAGVVSGLPHEEPTDDKASA
jgi:hypothetical protein